MQDMRVVNAWPLLSNGFRQALERVSCSVHSAESGGGHGVHPKDIKVIVSKSAIASSRR